MNYKPEPIDTSSTLVPKQLQNLMEILSRNTHETWAAQRIREGWTYGAERSDEKLHHPCLVAYDDLPESEKEYDRITAMETLKLILAMGYEVIPPAKNLERNDNPTNPLDFFKDENLDLSTLTHLWQSRDKSRWAADPNWFKLLGEKMLRFGEPLLAWDIVQEGLEAWPTNPRLKQLMALTMARIGITNDALDLLNELVSAGETDDETLGLLGRVNKDLFLEVKNEEYLLAAIKAYQTAFDNSNSIWTGINLATLHYLHHNELEASTTAQIVIDKSLLELEKNPEDYWTLATLGEAFLIHHQWDEALLYYRQATKHAQNRFGDLQSTRRNALLLLEKMKPTQKWLAEFTQCFNIPRVCVFTDEENKQTGDFAPTLVQSISTQLKKYNSTIGYMAAATDTDLLFLEALKTAHAKTSVVLPHSPELMTNDQDDLVSKQRMINALENATEVIILSGKETASTATTRQYLQRVVYGLARIRANQLDTELLPFVLQTTNENSPLTILEPKQVNDIETKTAESLHSVKALLFADTVNFSKLGDDEFPLFVKHLLGTAGEVLQEKEYHCRFRNTWGDALYLVFDSTRDAGLFALDFSERVNSIDWLKRGFSTMLKMRIALHAGPVFEVENPVTKDTNFIGHHVCRAARIEPVTPPGQVFASMEFAALSAAANVEEFSCKYVGQMAMPKKFGTFPTYHIKRATKKM